MTYSVALKTKVTFEKKGAENAVKQFDKVYGQYLAAWENHLNATQDMNPKQKKAWESENGFRDENGKYLENDKERFIAKWAIQTGKKRIVQIMLANNRVTIASAYNVRDYDKPKTTQNATSKTKGKVNAKQSPSNKAQDEKQTLDAMPQSITLSLVHKYATSEKCGNMNAHEIVELTKAIMATLAKENDVKYAGVEMAFQKVIAA